MGTARFEDYWNLPKVKLREGLKSSGKPFILVAPTLGLHAGLEFGNLGTNIDDHLDHVLAQLQKLGPPEFAPSKPLDIGQLIIAGHSGAYGPIAGSTTGPRGRRVHNHDGILENISKYKSKITEIWGFDIMYGDTASQLAGLKVPMYFYFNDTADNSRQLAQLAANKKNPKPNIFVMDAHDVPHDFLMDKFWADRCQRIGTNGQDSDDRKRMVHG